MSTYCTTLLVMAGFALCTALPASAEQQALIVIGTTGSSSILSDLAGNAQTIRDGLTQRGFAADAVEILSAQNGTPVTREAVLKALQGRAHLTAKDEFWLVLLGFSANSAGGNIAFQVAGPRLQAPDLKAALDAIPARQYVFVGTSDSGAFVPILLKSGRDVLAATAEEGEIDLPRFPESWAAALKDNPQASWRDLAADAAALTTQTYAQTGLAPGEHARLGVPTTGEVLDAPFASAAVAPTTTTTDSPAPQDSMDMVSAADIKVEVRKPNSEWEAQAATPETKKLIAEAKAAPNPNGFNAVLLEQKLGYTVGDDRTSENLVVQRIYIAREDGVNRWANFILPQDPPAVTTQLIAGRIIQPDGSSTVFNPAKMPPASDASSGICGSLTAVFMPGAHAGCLVEIAYRTRRVLDAMTPEYSNEFPVQQEIPVLLTELQLRIPSTGPIHYQLRNSDEKPSETEANGIRTLSWKFANLPAFEVLPFDPPERDLAIAVNVSSLQSWDEFVKWYQRLARGSDAQDQAVRDKAQELAATAKGRMDKLRKAFEFVSSLRYVAVEFGINGLRPRTPSVVLQNRYGDCKDKANLLIALLADMGIDGRFCVLNRGSSTDVNFPSWQFNHAVAYVPAAPAQGQPADLWLDTTDSTAPFPTLPPGDIGRSALVINHDTGQFLTISAPGEEGAEFDEHWQLQEKDDGTWSGSLHSVRSGLAEYELRTTVRGLSPQQREFALQSLLNKELRQADFSALNLAAADDLSVPLTLDAGLQLSSLAYPQPAFDAEAFFVAPTRDRPLLLDNGQKLHLVQTVEMTYKTGGPTQLPPPFQAQAAGLRASTVWDRVDDHTLRRTAELEITDPLIASADYSAARRLVRTWTDNLSSSSASHP